MFSKTSKLRKQAQKAGIFAARRAIVLLDGLEIEFYPILTFYSPR